MHEISSFAALSVALALAAGIVAQSIAQHLRIPGIVILLGAGVLLGPDGLNIVRPAELGSALQILVGFAVAVILFEGGLNLNWRRLRREAATIRRLVMLGAVVTAASGALAARLFLGWEWNMSILFGTLVIVTGPTVITPLLRRTKVSKNIETILNAEGVFIDAVGAIIAVVALEVALSPSGQSLALGFVSVPTRLVVGALIGVVGGVLLALLLRVRGVVPEGLENVFTLALALAIFQVSNAIMPESGIVSVIVAGLVVGNVRTPVSADLREFKEQLTVMLIGMLFVLLAADVRLADVAALGGGGVLVVLGLMFVARPLSVWLCTIGGKLLLREKIFLSWIAPRGIVAAAVATLFYERLAHEGIPGGPEMRAMVFLVIAATVVVQGGTGGLLARLLRLIRPTNQGYAILGAHDLGIALGRLLRDGGQEVLFIETNPEACKRCEEEGLRVLHGNAIEDRMMIRAEMETRRACIGTLANEAVNLLFATKARAEFKVPRAYLAIQRGHSAFDKEVVHEIGAQVLFGQETDIELWDVRIRREIASVRWFAYDPPEDAGAEADDDAPLVAKEFQNSLLPMVVQRDGEVSPVGDSASPQQGDEWAWLVFSEREEEAGGWLAGHGWAPASAAESDEARAEVDSQ